MTDIAIRVENLGKMYRIGVADRGPRTAWQAAKGLVASPFAYLQRMLRPPTAAETLWALRDVSFEVQRGEVLGVIGRNGAGKSTLLKILARITEPTEGRAEIHGRVGSLLEVGTGFHPELTGRENIYLNGAILGMKRAEIDRKFDEIVAFAEIERFLDTPVKRYSSGMYVRLAFAVAAHLEPEILLVDEVLAVGDAAFQKKCLGKMGDVAKQGRTVLFVSHNMGAVQALCRSALLVEGGRIQLLGATGAVVKEYLKASDVLATIPIADRTDRQGDRSGRLKFEALHLADAHDHPCDHAVTGEDICFRIRFSRQGSEMAATVPLDVAILIHDHQRNLITTLASFFTGESPTGLKNDTEVDCVVPRLPLLPGEYRLDLWCALSAETMDSLADAAILRVEPGNYFGAAADVRLPRADWHGPCVIQQKWLTRSRL